MHILGAAVVVCKSEHQGFKKVKEAVQVGGKDFERLCLRTAKRKHGTE
jgi:hypothetical protein